MTFDDEKREILSQKSHILWEVKEDERGNDIINLHPHDGFLYDEVEEGDEGT